MAASASTATQNSALGWTKLVGILFYLVVAPLFNSLVFKFVAWNWGVISIFAAILLFILLFLRNDLFRLLLFTFITLYLGTDFSVGFFRQFTTDQSVMFTIQDNVVLAFLMGGTGGRLVGAIVAGFILALAVILILIFILAFFSSYYVLALHEIDGVSLWDAIIYNVSLILGLNLSYIVVANGQAMITKEAGWLSVLGGPGHLVIKQGNVVVLERGGKITCILNAGVHKLMPLETMRNIFILGVQSSPADTTRIDHVLTKDRIPLTISAKITFQIEPASETDKRTESHISPNGEALTPKLDDGLYQVYEGTVCKAALMSQRLIFDQNRYSKCEEQICQDIEVTSWQKIAGSAPEGELRDYIMSHRFDELFELADGAAGGPPGVRVNNRKIYEIEQAILNQIKPTKLAVFGVLVRSVDIGKIEFPPDAADVLLNRWGAPWRQQIELIGAETGLQSKILEAQGEQQARMLAAQGEADASSLHAQAIVIHARAEAQRRIMEGRSQAEAKAAFFRFIVEALQVDGHPIDPELTRTILQQVAGTFASVNDLETFMRVQGKLHHPQSFFIGQSNVAAEVNG